MKHTLKCKVRWRSFPEFLGVTCHFSRLLLLSCLASVLSRSYCSSFIISCHDKVSGERIVFIKLPHCMTTQLKSVFILFLLMLHRSDGCSFLFLLLIAQEVSRLSRFFTLSERASVSCVVWGDSRSASIEDLCWSHKYKRDNNPWSLGSLRQCHMW